MTDHSPQQRFADACATGSLQIDGVAIDARRIELHPAAPGPASTSCRTLVLHIPTLILRHELEESSAFQDTDSLAKFIRNDLATHGFVALTGYLDICRATTGPLQGHPQPNSQPPMLLYLLRIERVDEIADKLCIVASVSA